MPAIELTPAQRREHRAEAHHLNPIVLIGNDGLTPAVTKEVDAGLNAHGLIKVRAASNERETREAWMKQLTEELGAAAVQHIGKLLVLWRPIPPKERPQTCRFAPGPPRGMRKLGSGPAFSHEQDYFAKPGTAAGAPRVVKIMKFSKSGNHRAQVKKLKVMGNERVTRGGLVKRARQHQVSLKKKGA
jgi:RNA-binding protein